VNLLAFVYLRDLFVSSYILKINYYSSTLSVHRVFSILDKVEIKSLAWEG